MPESTFGKKRQLTREESMVEPSSLRDINLSLKKSAPMQRRTLHEGTVKGGMRHFDDPGVPRPMNPPAPTPVPIPAPQPQGRVPVKFFLNADGNPTFFAHEYLKAIPELGDWFCFSGNEYTARKVVQDMRHGGGLYYVILVKEPTVAPQERKE